MTITKKAETEKKATTKVVKSAAPKATKTAASSAPKAKSPLKEETTTSVTKKVIDKKPESKSAPVKAPVVKVVKTTKPKSGSDFIYATGKRKSSVVKVRCFTTSGNSNVVTVNGRDFENYFTRPHHRIKALEALTFLGIASGYSFVIVANGGGLTGQADAIRLGISRVLAKIDLENRLKLRKNGFLTRDARQVESKKAGLRKARKREQFSKR